MLPEPEQQQIHKGRELALWLGLLLSPIAWALQMTINYALVPFQCYGGSRVGIFIVTIVSLLLTLTAGLIAFANFKRSRGKAEDSVGRSSREKFMSVLGMFATVMFFIAIVAQGIATIIFHPCLL
ncbi:MAG: hypothetical protein ABR555_14925 [Pyrinomonadaceae bacterium]